MADRFADARLKIARAEEHFVELQDRIKVWSEKRPIGVFDDHDSKTGWHTIRAEGLPDGPREWAPIIGDWAQNLRTALNYALVQLVLANSHPEKRSNQFPIFSTTPRASTYRGMVAGVAAKPRSIIQDLQPYMRPNRTEPELLEALAELSNIDKHSRPHLAAVLTAPFEKRFVKVTPLNNATLVQQSVPATFGEPIANTGLYRLRFDPPDTKIDVEMEGPIPIDVAFGNGRAAIPNAKFPHVVQEVRRVIELLAPFAPA